jgi:hypothetical protein
MGVYAPITGKTFSKRLLNKNLALTSRHYICARQVLRKTDFFMSCVKKTKEKSGAKLFWHQILSFYTQYKK